ncbi:toprim domain-containing protein [Parahaliea aestuarii]|uniref:Topoisomerase n=1 Tax=Parahaliea aestuarii TaxID=1852021 RepID=A0A5C9A4U6_9GAMM|nr:toprim domain-containing protein [Parahaliea aestuarii]TXS94750.1 topoisomerase [Parahaliea aestuarii]
MNQISSTSGADPVRSFADAVFSEIGAVLDPVPDGKIHRFDCPHGKKGNKAGWYALFLDQNPGGVFGNWRTGVTRTWRHDHGDPVGFSEFSTTSSAIEAANRKRELERTRARAGAACMAKGLWRKAGMATTAHPYLQKKNIPAFCLRQLGDRLLIPLRTVTGEMVNLQQIYPDGTKRFLKGGQLSGTFALFGRELPMTGDLYICEGWATAATIACTLRLPVVAAMTAGNLNKVANAIRAIHPALTLVIAADDDHATHGNPGMTQAAEAARAVNGVMTWPTTCRQKGCTCTDFNDVANCRRVP